MPERVPTLTDKEFLRQIALFLVEVNPSLRSKILDNKGEIMSEIISEAENIIYDEKVVYSDMLPKGMMGEKLESCKNLSTSL